MLPAITINGRFLTQRMVGVQRFAVEVVKAIDGLLADGEYKSLKGSIEILAPSSARELLLRHIPVRRRGMTSGYFWEQVEFPIYGYGRLLLSLCMLGPVAVRRQIVVIHDATVRAQPGNFTRRFRAAYNFIIPRICRRAYCAVTVSEFSRREIGKWFGVDVSKMPVCFEGGEHIASVPPDESIIDRLGLRGRKFFLSVGAGKNKNVNTVTAAFVKAKLDDTSVVLTGYRQSRVNGSYEEVLSDRMTNAGYVSDGELRALYEHALALVCPSRYEGFGLPPIEAMACGCPVIISNQPAMLEVCGDAALQCEADDADELARLMRLVHDDPVRRAALIAAGRERAALFTWRATARRLLDLCVAAASRGAQVPAVRGVPQAGESF
ncbi:MAG: glycosyltransferase family 1 protein [Xanthobacteraceae bacterium]|jgi:glycosyltransferase involved in cell wall biosynthesis